MKFIQLSSYMMLMIDFHSQANRTVLFSPAVTLLLEHSQVFFSGIAILIEFLSLFCYS